MRDVALESIVESLTVVIEVGAMVLLTVLGLLAESTGFARLATDLDALTIWYVFVGALALYTAVYMLGYRRLLPRVRAVAG